MTKSKEAGSISLPMTQSFTPTSSQNEILATISSKGQVTIPVVVRRQLGLKKHDKIAFVLGQQGNIIVQAPKYPTLASLQGAAGRLKKPLSWKDMLRIAREDHVDVFSKKQR
ncbi:MAG TPA: type II toxin-antitoxin system PrlF family antitoxin [Ktedonobacterales bacterium]|nr:type II toxin-antitoxin system PrlF family antitoxin [Ktedonobacterales bacterium]